MVGVEALRQSFATDSVSGYLPLFVEWLMTHMIQQIT